MQEEGQWMRASIIEGGCRQCRCSPLQIRNSPLQQFPSVHHLGLPPLGGEMAFVAGYHVSAFDGSAHSRKRLSAGSRVTVRGTTRAADSRGLPNEPDGLADPPGFMPNLGRRSTPSYSIESRASVPGGRRGFRDQSCAWKACSFAVCRLRCEWLRRLSSAEQAF